MNTHYTRNVAAMIFVTVISASFVFAMEGMEGASGTGNPSGLQMNVPVPMQTATQRPDSSFRITIEFLDQLDMLPGDLGPLPPVPVPENNPQTPEKIELGKLLFFDVRLSGNGHWACATCHNPALAFTDGLPRGLGFLERELGRHTPTIMNTAYYTTQFWDGRANSLEEQASMPVLSMSEMNISEEELVERLTNIPNYIKRFNDVFGGPPSLQRMGMAVAAYERTIVTGVTRFDRYIEGDKQALTAKEKRGLILFIGKASCSACHSGPNFSDNDFHNIGTKHVGPLAVDLGRMAVTRESKDMHAFKTPGLRNIELTPPYMHDGVLRTLGDVVDFYDKGGENTMGKSERIKPLGLTKIEKAQLVAFMRALTSDEQYTESYPLLPLEDREITYGPRPFK